MNLGIFCKAKSSDLLMSKTLVLSIVGGSLRITYTTLLYVFTPSTHSYNSVSSLENIVPYILHYIQGSSLSAKLYFIVKFKYTFSKIKCFRKFGIVFLFFIIWFSKSLIFLNSHTKFKFLIFKQNIFLTFLWVKVDINPLGYYLKLNYYQILDEWKKLHVIQI